MQRVPVARMSVTQIATPHTSTISRPLAAPAAIRRRWTLAYALYTIANNASFTQAVWVIYLYSRGFSPLAIGLFETAFHLAKFLAEVPTGIFADLAGRRKSLIVSCVVAVAAELLFLWPTAPLMAASFALSGVAYAFKGGAASALLWTMAERSGAADTTRWYSRMFSRMFVVLLLAGTIGTASGGFLAGISPTLPFLMAALAAAVSIAPLLLLPEQKVAASVRTTPLAHLGAGLRATWRDPLLLGLLLLSGLTASAVTTVGYYTQLYFSSLGFSLAMVGLIFAITVVPDALFAAAAPRIMRRLGRGRVLALFTAAEALGLLLMSARQPWLGLVGFVGLVHVGDAVLYPAISTYLNERSPEAQRATVLSLETGLFSAMMIVLFPLFGLGLTHVSFATVYLGTFAALAAGSLGIAATVRALGRRSLTTEETEEHRGERRGS